MPILMVIGSKTDVPLSSTARVSRVDYSNHMLKVTGDHISSIILYALMYPHKSKMETT